MDINVTFIWHDCFVIKLPECVIITDYWREADTETGQVPKTPGFLKDIEPHIPVYVLVSHHHKDHFTRKIFLWAAYFSNIHYIISSDTARSIKYILNPDSTYNGEYRIPSHVVTVLKPGERFRDHILSVRAFASTDIGNSYLIRYNHRTIFHAGDLNAWIWKDESTENEVNAAISQFRTIVESIRANAPEIDLAFFPVDSRIGTDWWEGAAIFVREIKVRYFIPMHFCLAESPQQLHKRIADATAFNLYENTDRGEYIGLTKPYSSCNLQL